MGKTANLSLAGVISLLLIFRSACAQQDVRPGLFYDAGSHVSQSFWGTNLFLQTAAVAFTYASSQYGWDYRVHHFFYEHPSVGAAGYPSAGVGALVPILSAGGLYAYGYSRQQPDEVVAGHAVTQAVALAFTYHELLKAVTGRPAPQGVPESNMDEQSRQFKFGWMRGGLFWGWPSGHLATNTAAITALSGFYPESKTLSVVKYAWISYMFYGVVSHQKASMHWFSDAVAGTMMGWAFGSTIGKGYHDKVHPRQSASGFADRIHVFPTTIAQAPGLQIDIVL